MTQDADGSAPMLGSVANYPVSPDGWIPVRARMPPVGARVLYTCFIDDGVDAWWTEVNSGEWDGKSLNAANNPAMKYDDSNDWEPCSHWMPLPAPPTDDK